MNRTRWILALSALGASLLGAVAPTAAQDVIQRRVEPNGRVYERPVGEWQPTTTVRTSAPRRVYVMPVQVTEPAPATYIEPPHERGVRFRFGIEGMGGGTIGDPNLGFGGLRLQAGVQLGDAIAVYYQPTGVIAGIETDGADQWALGGMMWNSLLVDFTLFNFLQLGAGPSMDFVWGCEAAINDQVGCADEGPFIGMDGRVAVQIGGGGHTSRRGFTLSANVHPTWYGRDQMGVSITGGAGFTMY